MELLTVWPWPLLAVAGYVLVLVSLWLGCRICALPKLSAGRLALAAVPPLLLLAVYYLWLVAMQDALRFLSPGPEVLLFPLPVFFAALLGAPWFLRSATGRGWGREWGAAAVGGLVLSVLLSLSLWLFFAVLTQRGSREYETAQATQATSVLAGYGLPIPIDAGKYLSVISTQQYVLDLARKPGRLPANQASWMFRWPRNDMLSFFSKSPQAALIESVAASLGHAGFSVQRGTNQPVAGVNEPYLVAQKPGLFVLYRFSENNFEGYQSSCMVEVWRDFAKEMEAECAAETQAK